MESSTEKTLRSKGFHSQCDKPKYSKSMADFQKIFGLSNIVSKNIQGHFIIQKYDINKTVFISCDNCLALFEKDGK